MFLASQLADVSSRFSAHVEDVREFFRKEGLRVPSPETIPQLSSRVGSDLRFRADLASLMRAILYEEREGIGYEDLLKILVTAAAGAEHDLKSESQEADIRELLRFLLQSRRPTFRPEADETTAAVDPEPRESVRVAPAQAIPEPVLRPRGRTSVAHSMKLELTAERADAAARDDTRGPADVVLPPFRTSGLFAAHTEVEDPWWRAHSAWIVGVVCMVLGLGLGLTFRQAVSAAQKNVGIHAVIDSFRHAHSTASLPPRASDTEQPNGTVAQASPEPVSQAGPPASVAPKAEPGSAPVETAPVRAGDAASNGMIARSPTPQPASGVPVTVVRQVVTAPDDPLEDTADPTAATRSIVPRGSAGIMPANVIFSPPPDYPAEAAAARVHGQVTVRAVVDPEGKVIYARAVSGPSALRGPAQEAVQRWRYRPLMYNGKPIAVPTVAILDFKVAR